MSSRLSVALSLLSFVLLSTVLFDVSSVSAATPYDNLLHVTDKILIRDNNGNENDITTTYMGAILSYLNDNPTNTHAQNLYSKLQSNTASGVGWSMIGYRDGVAGHGNAKTRWFLDIYDTNASGAFFNGPNGYTFGMSHYVGRFMFTWASGGLVATPNPSYDTQPWWGANTNCGSGSPEYMCFSSSGLTQTDIFYINTPIVYPPGYQGQTPPSSQNPKTDFYPEFEYAVSDRGIAITQFKRIPGGLNRFDVKLFKADDNYNSIGDPVDTDLNRLLYAGSNSYVEAPSYGKYVLDVYIYPPPGSDLLDEFNFKSAFIHLNIDGSTFTGTSYGENCTNGSCSTPPIYEDCDLIDIPCHFRNFWAGLKALFIFIFIPSSSDMSRLFDDANSFIHTKFGFLTYPFDWIYSLFGAMANSSAACNGVSLSGIPSVSPGDKFFGSPVNLNVCSAEHDFPKIYNIAVFFIRVVLVLAMVAAVYRKFLVTLGDHGSRYQDGRTEELYR